MIPGRRDKNEPKTSQKRDKNGGVDGWYVGISDGPYKASCPSERARGAYLTSVGCGGMPLYFAAMYGCDDNT